MKKITLFLTVAISAMALIGCSTAANTNTTTVGRTNANTAAMNSSNTATVVNAQGNMETGAMNSNSTAMGNMTRADYDRDKDRYAKEAKDAGRTIGTGANDGWLWTKTRAALATTAGLRDSTVNVDVSNEVVTLTGTVATAAQKTQAETVAKGIEGVKSVTNNLKVQAGDSLANQAVGTGGANTANANRR